MDIFIPNIVLTLGLLMSNNSDHSIEHHIQTYIRVFIALGVLTVITVAVSYLEVSFIEAFFLAITIASIKGSLVCLLYTSPSPRDLSTSRMPSSA